MVKITDVYPDGRSILLQDGIQRLRWRAGPEASTPSLAVPGKVYELNVSLWNTSYVFQAGHSVRITVSSSNSPRFKPNPNTGKPLSEEDGTLIKTTNTVGIERSDVSTRSASKRTLD